MVVARKKPGRNPQTYENDVDNRRTYTRPGIGVDSRGGQVIDPTKNVLDLFEAGTRRQDDLNELRDQLTNAKVRRLEDIGDLRAKHTVQLSEMREKLSEKLSEQREKYNDKIADLREKHNDRNTAREAQRIDSIRAVDVQAGDLAYNRALTAIQTLANTTTSTATALAAQWAATVGRLDERVGAIEKISAIAMGKEGVVDPQMAQALAEIKRLTETIAMGVGATSGKQTAADSSKWMIATAVSVLTAMFILASVVVPQLRSSALSVAPPQVIYMPAPTGTMLPSPPISSTK